MDVDPRGGMQLLAKGGLSVDVRAHQKDAEKYGASLWQCSGYGLVPRGGWTQVQACDLQGVNVAHG